MKCPRNFQTKIIIFVASHSLQSSAHTVFTRTQIFALSHMKRSVFTCNKYLQILEKVKSGEQFRPIIIFYLRNEAGLMGIVKKVISKKIGSQHNFSCSLLLQYQTNTNNLYFDSQIKVKCTFQLKNFLFSGFTFPTPSLQLSAHNCKFYKLVYILDRQHFEILFKTEYSEMMDPINRH